MAHDASDVQPRRSRRVAIIGAGPGGICTGVSTARPRPRRLRDPRAGAGHRRHLVPQPLSRAPSATSSRTSTRSRSSPTPTWSRRYAAPARDQGLPRRRRRPLRPPPPPAALHAGAVACGGTTTSRCGTSTVATARQRRVVDADVVVSAIGMFSEPRGPTIPGLDRFEGTMFHSARLGRRPRPHRRAGGGDRQRGQRGAVRARDRARRRPAAPCTSARRTGCSPKDDDPVHRRRARDVRAPTRRRCRRRATRSSTMIDPDLTFADPDDAARTRRRSGATSTLVEDPRLRRGSPPSHPTAAKRPLMLERLLPDVQPAARRAGHRRRSPRSPSTGSSPPTARRARSTRSSSPPGSRRPSSSPRIDVIGRGGARHRRRLGRRRRGVPRHHHRGFPNLFMLYGPNTNNGSIIYMIECQVHYVMEMLDAMDERRPRLGRRQAAT